ncbi:MAG: YkgJ family cysteine cluster protein [Thermoplasmatota archaeon]
MKGAVCSRHGCSHCCHGTEMALTLEDVGRISDSGRSDFYHEDTMELRNVDGRCFFLSTEGRCTIYDIRPSGCRLYPLIMALPSMTPLLDEECPHRVDFRIEPEEVIELRRLIDTLIEEGL